MCSTSWCVRSSREMLATTGTRHVAGLGMAELCDALVIVVSEEWGTVSVASERTLSELEGAAELRNIITTFREETDDSERDDPFHWARHRLGLKLVSLTVASVLWISWVHRTDKVQQAFDQIPVHSSRKRKIQTNQDLSTGLRLYTQREQIHSSSFHSESAHSTELLGIA